MTQSIIRNSLYSHLWSVINGALPLEYAIRNTKLLNQDTLQSWGLLDREIREYWLRIGATNEEIDREELMDFAWDTIQFGFPLSRAHGRFYPNQEFLDIINRGLADVRSCFVEKLDPLRIPVTRKFRICDLLHGNDIPNLLNATAECLNKASELDSSPEISLADVVKGIREPIILHEGFRFVSQEKECERGGVESFGFTLDTDADISINELKQLVREYLYQYAIRRMTFNPTPEMQPLSRALIDDFLRENLFRKEQDNVAPRYDSFVTRLSGIYCWDRHQYRKLHGTRSPLDSAIEDTIAIYPKQRSQVGEEAIRKNYNDARRRIAALDFR